MCALVAEEGDAAVEVALDAETRLWVLSADGAVELNARFNLARNAPLGADRPVGLRLHHGGVIARHLAFVPVVNDEDHRIIPTTDFCVLCDGVKAVEVAGCYLKHDRDVLAEREIPVLSGVGDDLMHVAHARTISERSGNSHSEHGGDNKQNE